MGLVDTLGYVTPIFSLAFLSINTILKEEHNDIYLLIVEYTQMRAFAFKMGYFDIFVSKHAYRINRQKIFSLSFFLEIEWIKRNGISAGICVDWKTGDNSMK